MRLERNAQALLLSFQHHCVIPVHHTDTCRHTHTLANSERKRETPGANIRKTGTAGQRKRGKEYGKGKEGTI